jgi:lysine 2,3-aminomutase
VNADQEWQDQIRNSIRTVEALKEYIPLTPREEREIREVEGEFSWWITPYYASLMDPDDPDCPIRKQVVPHVAELHDPLGVIDPLEEEKHNPAPNVIKVYPDRIAWCVANRCASLCRHCLRKRMVGRENFSFGAEAQQAALDYIARTP